MFRFDSLNQNLILEFFVFQYFLRKLYKHIR
ncbi:MAG: Unknown protein [uncultured Aureispira sp.]|uniref:Uncharacterized protein n=1 Tax=uncultured Aureispira sp. TaxID=1331704 RepID=A0A6S6TQY5_9BACT|nr:MAG: Unknown protein [uncultured Aureispira sp.]